MGIIPSFSIQAKMLATAEMVYLDFNNPFERTLLLF